MLLEAQSALCNLSNPAPHQGRQQKTTTGASFDTHTCTCTLLEFKRFMTPPKPNVTVRVCVESLLQHQIILTLNTTEGSRYQSRYQLRFQTGSDRFLLVCHCRPSSHTFHLSPQNIYKKPQHPTKGRRRKRIICPPCSPLCCQGNSGHLAGPVGLGYTSQAGHKCGMTVRGGGRGEEGDGCRDRPRHTDPHFVSAG